MSDYFKLQKEISSTSNDIDPNDIVSAKRRFRDLGLYQEPEWGITNFTDNALFKAIKTFQEMMGLKVDGVMKPDGETEEALDDISKHHEADSSKIPGHKVFNSPETEEKNNNQEETTQPTAQTSSQPTQIQDFNRIIFDRVSPTIKGHEDYKEFPYRDSKEKITTGYGNLIDKPEQFNKLKWIDKDGRPISSDEVQRQYQILRNIPGTNYKADYYRDKTTLRLSAEDSQRLFDEHFQQDLNNVRNTFKNFDQYPAELQDVLLDINFNTGNVNPKKWPQLHKAIEAKDLSKIIENVHRVDVNKERNQWAKDHLSKIERLNY